MSGKNEFLSQVFLKDRDLVCSLLERSSICRGDIVVEIGPGEGIITSELLKKAGRVIAVEKDSRLYRTLQLKYQGASAMELHNNDFLNFDPPLQPYKVFSNIPFAIESQVVRKFIDHSTNPPIDCYLIMRREVTERLAGYPREGRFSMLHKPWFDLEVFYYFRRGDFRPKPLVESAMLRFKKKDIPLINRENKRMYDLFITSGFGGGRRVRQNLSGLFTLSQLERLAQDSGFRVGDMPSDLTFNQWMGMFEFVSNKMPQIQKQKFILRSKKFLKDEKFRV